MQLGAWQLDTINGGRFRIDGGVLFGLVPKSLWAPLAPADAQNRVGCGNHCVLARDGRHTVLIDTGCGTKFAPLDRKFYAMEEGDPLLEDLAALGVAPEDIDTVVLTHLHFDHVGGATRFDHQGQLVPTFPKARYVVSRIEWEDATSGGSGAANRLFRRTTCCRWQKPASWSCSTATRRSCPELTALCTGGHTRGHLAVKFCFGGADRILHRRPLPHHRPPPSHVVYGLRRLSPGDPPPQAGTARRGGQTALVGPLEPRSAGGRRLRGLPSQTRVRRRRAATAALSTKPARVIPYAAGPLCLRERAA